ncbi:hypothetical protein [Methanosarcina siciliae]|uniref:hypothetical protein n=1 Tax=Methanosarcina siciliae TaxID=38027 RepID=UPI00064F596B|nr:hypothetical protein [Methanosarcina siciliae]
MYLKFPGRGHFPGQIGEKLRKNKGNFYKQEKLQISWTTGKLERKNVLKTCNRSGVEMRLYFIR